MPDDIPAGVVQPPPEGIPVNPDKVMANVLSQLTQANLAAAKWQALAEDLMSTCQQQQEMITELKKRPVHAGRVTKSNGSRKGGVKSAS